MRREKQAGGADFICQRIVELDPIDAGFAKMNFIQLKSWRAFLSRVWLPARWFRKPEPGIASGRFAADGPCIRQEACACRIDQRGSIRFQQIDAHRIRRSKPKLRKPKRDEP